MTEVTRILSAIERGDACAADQLLPVVYAELRRLAAQRMSHERSSQTLQPTALVHEAYLRLVDLNEPQQWNGRGHFFAAAAEAMRRILVERARRRARGRHGGDRKRVDLDLLHAQLEQAIDRAGNPVDADGDDVAARLLALDAALNRLAEEDHAAAEVVKLRYFAGLTIEQSAEAAGISVRTANRHWAYAKAWLYEQLRAAR